MSTSAWVVSLDLAPALCGEPGLIRCAFRTGRHIIQPVPQTTEVNLRARLQRWLLATILALAGTAALTFGVDYLIFRIRASTNWSAYDSVTVRHYYAVLHKNGKTEFLFDPPQPWTCVNALFPHAGSLPCWYLRRHPEQRTNI